ncbi:hypothetical protein ACFLRA_00610 [Bdellovibrionota bacterium]
MKILLVLTLLFTPLVSSGNETNRELEELKNRVEAMERAIEEKLSDCRMTYRHHAYRLNICDKGTFVRSMTDVGGSVQLECGYYQLRCSTDLPEPVTVD